MHPLDHLGTAPLDDRPRPALSDATRDWLAWLEALREDEQYGYADDTLAGIAETVRRTNRVTDAQRQAVHHIMDGAARAADRHDRRRGGPGWSRRYEGWRR